MNILLESYNGPLELLYDLIMKHKVDIYDISIFEITEQYLNSLEKMKEMDLNLTTDFIIMACKLIEIKSKYLLFKNNELEQEEDPRNELVDRLIVYRKFKNASEFLKEKLVNSKEIFFRKKEEHFINEELDLSSLSIDMLIKCIPILIKYNLVDEKEDVFEKICKEKYINVEEKMMYVKTMLDKEGAVAFSSIIKTDKKDDVIATFLSVLELMKLREIIVYQEMFFSDIILKKAR